MLVALTQIALAGDAAAERLKVAIVAGEAINLDDSTVDALGQDMAEALGKELDISIVGGLEVRRLLPEGGLPEECVVTPSCTAEIARTLKVDEILFLVLIKNGATGAIQIDTTWVAPSTGKRGTRPAITLATGDSNSTRFAASALKLLPDAPVRPMPVNGPSVQVGRGRPRHFTVPSLITAGVTVAALGTGIGFAVSTRSRYTACDEDGFCKEGEKKTIRARGIVADVSFVVALAGAITTAVLYGTSAESPRVMVSPSKDGATVTGMLRF
jgi:hypothetical protein